MRTWLLPLGWEWKKLNDLCKTTSGGTPSRGNPGYFSGDIPWIKSGELNDGLITDSEEHITADAIESSNAKKLLKGTLLIAMYGATVGKLGILDIEAATNQAVCAIFPGELLNRNYLFWFLKSYRKDLIQASFGGAQPNISQALIRSIEVPIPFPDNKEKSLDIQNRIVQRIENAADELAEARRLHEKIVADTNRLMDAVLAEYFPKFEVALPEGWEWKPISFLAHDTDRQNPTITTPNEYFNYIDISGVDNAIGAVTDPKSMLGQDAPSRARKIVHTNDVIFATTRPYLKNIALIPLNLDHSICSTGFCVLVPKADNCVPQYLYYAARSESVIQQLIPKQRGASYPAVLDQDIFGSFIPIPYPGDPAKSKTSQEIIAKRITEMGESVSEAQIGNTKTGALLNQIEQSILAQAFRGEL